MRMAFNNASHRIILEIISEVIVSCWKNYSSVILITVVCVGSAVFSKLIIDALKQSVK